MRQQSFITCLFSIFVMVAGSTFAETTSTATVEFTAPLHFLTPGGEDVEVEPGIYQVEAAEAWLKLVPEGKGRSEAVLVEAIQGTHDETLTEPTVRLEGEPENSDVFHLALLLVDGTGLEAVGTVSGIRPRGFNLAFVSKTTQPSRRFTQRPRVKQKSSPPIVLQPGLTLPKLEGKVVVPPPRPQASCGPSHEFIPGSVLTDDGADIDNWDSQPHMAVFRNELHVVAVRNDSCKKMRGQYCGALGLGQQFAHFKFNGERWVAVNKKQKESIGVIDNGMSMALAVFDKNLWAVWKDDDKQLWYSWYYDQWVPKRKISGQKSKSTPALAVKGGRLHLLHQGKTTDDLWYSRFTLGSGWSTNVKIGQKSEGTPGFSWFNDGFLHVMYQRAGVRSASGEQRFTTLFHSYLGRSGTNWLTPYQVPQAKSQDTPILLNASTDVRGRGLMVHRGSSTKRLWSMLYGRPNPKRPITKWYDDRRLLNLTSDGPVALAFYKGCVHMVHKDGKKLIHSTFSLKQAHPEALK